LHRRFFLSALSIPLFSSGSVALEGETWSLVTVDEFERENSQPPINQPIPAEVPNGPTIVVEQPDEAKAIKSPVSVQIAFRPHADAKIDKASLKVMYGFFGIDITKRIIEHAVLTETGLTAQNAQIPAGQHKVTIEISEILISDNVTRRVGRRAINFTVI
jgi:hypothetical protein